MSVEENTVTMRHILKEVQEGKRQMNFSLGYTGYRSWSAYNPCYTHKL